MRKLLVLVAVLALALALIPLRVAASAKDDTTVKGIAKNAQQDPLPNATVKLVNSKNQEVATQTTAQNGAFSFTGVAPDTYTVQIVVGGKLVGSVAITVAAGQVAAITIPTTVAAAIAGGAAGGFFTTTSLLVLAGLGGAAATVAVVLTASGAQ